MNIICDKFYDCPTSNIECWLYFCVGGFFVGFSWKNSLGSYTNLLQLLNEYFNSVIVSSSCLYQLEETKPDQSDLIFIYLCLRSILKESDKWMDRLTSFLDVYWLRIEVNS